jgi:asparagine synthase (glutamine-hydrolysing)
MGKAALARAPSIPLPDAVLSRAKTGFGVPTGAWMTAASPHGKRSESAPEPKGLVSRRWSHVVIAAGNSEREALAL